MPSGWASLGVHTIIQVNSTLEFHDATGSYSYSFSARETMLLTSVNANYKVSYLVPITVYDIKLQYLDTNSFTWLSDTVTLDENTVLSSEHFPTVPNPDGMTFSHWELISGSALGTALTQDTILRAVYI